MGKNNLILWLRILDYKWNLENYIYIVYNLNHRLNPVYFYAFDATYSILNMSLEKLIDFYLSSSVVLPKFTIKSYFGYLESRFLSFSSSSNISIKA